MLPVVTYFNFIFIPNYIWVYWPWLFIGYINFGKEKEIYVSIYVRLAQGHIDLFFRCVALSYILSQKPVFCACDYLCFSNMYTQLESEHKQIKYKTSCHIQKIAEEGVIDLVNMVKCIWDAGMVKDCT